MNLLLVNPGCAQEQCCPWLPLQTMMYATRNLAAAVQIKGTL